MDINTAAGRSSFTKGQAIEGKDRLGKPLGIAPTIATPLLSKSNITVIAMVMIIASTGAVLVRVDASSRDTPASVKTLVSFVRHQYKNRSANSPIPIVGKFASPKWASNV